MIWKSLPVMEFHIMLWKYLPRGNRQLVSACISPVKQILLAAWAPGKRNCPVKFSFFIDRGGTFTDVIAIDEKGRLEQHKLLSENPAFYKNSIIAGIKAILARHCLPFSKEYIQDLRVGTTVATNAILERTGAKTLFLVTAGFKDLLKIGYQNRPDIFARHIQKNQQLYHRVIEVEERVLADGTVSIPLNKKKLAADLERARRWKIKSVAVCFVHGYKYPHHEDQAAALCHEFGFEFVSVSHQVASAPRAVPRATTTILDAYLAPVLKRYVREISLKAGKDFLMMQSNGGLCRASQYQAKDSLLSGPAGGVIGGIETAHKAGAEKIIGFDMGGTSTDVWHYAGHLERVYESTVDGLNLHVPMLDIHTIAAGGGSILSLDQGRLQVGPSSAGAQPGPACYRQGGPLAITDAHVLLGNISPLHFPHVFGRGGDQALDDKVVKKKFSALSAKASKLEKRRVSGEEVAAGFIDVADEMMADAIRTISLKKGRETRGYVLNCFGGAGGLHACSVAEKLGLEKVYIHRQASLLSAYGLALAGQRFLTQVNIEKTLNGSAVSVISSALGQLKRQAARRAKKEGIGQARLLAQLGCHYEQSETLFSIEVDPAELNESVLRAIEKRFHQLHQKRFGFCDRKRPVVIQFVSLETIEEKQAFVQRRRSTASKAALAMGQAEVFFNSWQKADLFLMKDLATGGFGQGPAIIFDEHTTVLVKPGWKFVMNTSGLTLQPFKKQPVKRQKYLERARLEIFNHAFYSLAEQMGVVLQSVSRSVNIRERFDFSCALFDAGGELIANAPHIPVHLGSMSECVKSILKQHGGSMRPGDAYLANNPFKGGTHLPDLTVVTPCFVKGQLVFFLASRGHHADIGGISPGSMPAGSTTIEQEGVVFDNLLVSRGGRFFSKQLLQLLNGAEYPARSPQVNLADIQAKLAANERGRQELNRLLHLYTVDELRYFAAAILKNTNELVRKALIQVQPGEYSVTLDNKKKVKCRLQKKGGSVVFDFTGSSGQSGDNSNASSAIVQAAVMYSTRLLLDQPVPLNGGCLKPLTIKLNPGSLLNPAPGAAIAAGNVETSQALVDCLLMVMGIMACSQGTMNNLTFGDSQVQYYETICGGTGAGPGFDGTDAVQSHMTNSRLTDVEILESRFAVEVVQFKVRRGSGGKGRHQGGNGVTRLLRFSARYRVEMISNRRKQGAPGLKGGGTGAPGKNTLIRGSKRKELPASFSIEVEPGDMIEIKTPGGGGYGRA